MNPVVRIRLRDKPRTRARIRDRNRNRTDRETVSATFPFFSGRFFSSVSHRRDDRSFRWKLLYRLRLVRKSREIVFARYISMRRRQKRKMTWKQIFLRQFRVYIISLSYWWHFRYLKSLLRDVFMQTMFELLFVKFYLKNSADKPLVKRLAVSIFQILISVLIR